MITILIIKVWRSRSLLSEIEKNNHQKFQDPVSYSIAKINTLEKEYEWESDISYGKNQWRMGDGQTAFNNFVYYTVAGFSEYDNFRANQIREGIITREEGLKLAEEDNKIKYNTLKIYSEIIGFNLDSVLSKVSCIPKLY